MHFLTKQAVESKLLSENWRKANIIPQGHANGIRKHILAFIHFCWVTEVIEFSLETIKIIYDYLSSEDTWTMKESPAWLYISVRPLQAHAANVRSTFHSPSGGILNLFAFLFCIKIDCLRLWDITEKEKKKTHTQRSDVLSTRIQTVCSCQAGQIPPGLSQ